MSRIGLRDERLERLAAMVARQGVLKLRAVANDLGVSQMTVRRDVMQSGGRFACLGGHVIGAQNDVPPAWRTVSSVISYSKSTKPSTITRPAPARPPVCA